MRKSALIALVIILSSMISAADAQQGKRIAILPFTVNSSENIDYVRQGIWDMLISRVSASGKVDVLSKSTVQDAMTGRGKEITPADATAIAKKLNAEYVVMGSITKIGDGLSLDGRLIDVASNQSPVTLFEQTKGMNDIIPKITDFAQRIRASVTGESMPAAATPAAPTAPAAPPAAVTATVAATGAAAAGTAAGKSSESEIVTGMRKGKTTYTGIITPEFINSPSGSLDRRGFWMSPKYGIEFKGMDIGDVNGDGLNEIVVIDTHNVYIYQKKGNDFAQLKKIPGADYQTYIGVDVADINGNGIPEIIVTSLNRLKVESFVLEYRNGDYALIAEKLPWLLRVITTDGSPRLLGQRLAQHTGYQATDNNHFINPIHRIQWTNGQYVEGEKIRIPVGLSVYGTTLDVVDGRTERVITYDSYDYLRIYEKTDKLLVNLTVFMSAASEQLWKSDEPFGGSNNSFRPEFASGTRSMVDTPDSVYLNLRILSYDPNKTGKKQFIVVKNLSGTARLMKNLPLYTGAEVYNLEWDGLGLAENWRTRKINGYIADYQIKDLDNDGEDEIVLAMVLSVGTNLRTNSCIVSYKLPKAEAPGLTTPAK